MSQSLSPSTPHPSSPSSAFSPSSSSLAQFGLDDEESALPKKPLTASPTRRGLGLHPSFYILNWIFFSNTTILFNKWLLDSAGFRYPILLTCWHLIFATFATQVLARTTSLLDSRHGLAINGRIYLRTIVPIGLFYSGSLVCSNLVYLYLSVAFIQMLKSASPVTVLFVSWVWGVAEPNCSTLVNILVIVAGVALASFGEIRFSFIGFFFQVGGIVFEAIRLVMIQVMLSGEGLKMDPLVSLYYYAPICAFMNILVAIPSELPRLHWSDISQTGFSVLFLNALVAFMLNIASVFLIGKTSGLVMTLAGIFKNILLIIVSVAIWHTEITALQFFGYSISLAGLIYYSLGYDQLLKIATLGKGWTYALCASSSAYGSVTLTSRRFLIVGTFVIGTLLILTMALRRYDPISAYAFAASAESDDK